MRRLKMYPLIPFACGKAIENPQRRCELARPLKNAEPGEEDDIKSSISRKKGQEL